MAEENTVYNDDILGIVTRIDRFLQEVNKSVSANLTNYTDFDTGRLTSYLGAIRNYVAWVDGQPQLDLPETSPDARVAPVAPELAEPDNPMVTDVLRLLLRMQIGRAHV